MKKILIITCSLFIIGCGPSAEEKMIFARKHMIPNIPNIKKRISTAGEEISNENGCNCDIAYTIYTFEEHEYIQFGDGYDSWLSIQQLAQIQFIKN